MASNDSVQYSEEFIRNLPPDKSPYANICKNSLLFNALVDYGAQIRIITNNHMKCV